ncbi:MAG: NADH-quinone oxidoreductase subunit N [Anaerolineae bacterium]|nr:NADH-quinone oxidoreductase subunit N [Thermoflexales bacterium]MDW8407079.1 NADH-quinone oxidoreductase subunit N [Anaerolineae bacterium]
MAYSVFDPSQFLAIAPEIGLMLWALVILALDMVSGRRIPRRTLGVLAAAGMAGVLFLSLLIATPPQIVVPELGSDPRSVLGGMIRHDLFAFVFRIIFIAAGILTCLVSIDFRPLRAAGEYYALLILSTMAMGLMAASNDLIMLYLATEASSFALYLLAGFMRDTPRSAEAGIKYFVFGAAASTVMLYGLALLFGLSGGQTGYAAVAQLLAGADTRMAAVLAVLLIIVGFAFKTSAVPFHFWTPDVYEGAPTPFVGFLSTASKAAGFAILMRFLLYVFEPPFSQAAVVWVQLMQPLAILTMFLGNLLAITQSSIKRMLAYSSIAQAGYMLIGVTAFGFAYSRQAPEAAADAAAAVIFYAATYMLTNIAAFAVVSIVSQRVGSEQISAFNGLARRAPYLALGMTAAMLSLLGAPPLVGFVGKLFLFRAAIADSLVMLVVVGVLNVLISVFYYLGIVRAMYVERSSDDPLPLPTPTATGWVVLLSSTAILFITVASTQFWGIAVDAAKALLN